MIRMLLFRFNKKAWSSFINDNVSHALNAYYKNDTFTMTFRIHTFVKRFFVFEVESPN